MFRQPGSVEFKVFATARNSVAGRRLYNCFNSSSSQKIVSAQASCDW
jgi:hypothetical protein